MRVALGEEREHLRPLHQGEPVADHAAEAVEVPLAFGRLAAERGDLLGILARAHEIETEIGFETLLLEIERDELAADSMRERGADRRIDQRRPHQIAGDVEACAEDMQRRARRQCPQDDDERAQRHDRVENSDADRQREIHEQLQVFGDALVGIVGGVTEKLHAVVIGGVEPMAQIVLRHPAPPAYLQPLIEIDLVHRDHGVDGREHAEEQDGADESVPIAVLERVVKAVVPLVQNDLNGDDRQLERDHRGEQYACRPAVFGPEVGQRQPPDRSDRRYEVFHGGLDSGLSGTGRGRSTANAARQHARRTSCGGVSRVLSAG